MSGTFTVGARRRWCAATLFSFALLLAATADVARAGGAPDALRIESVRVGTAKAPVVMRAEMPRGASVKARVNGRPARVAFDRVTSRVRSVQLTTHNGLRDGRNRIGVRAELPNGRSSREARVVHLPQGDPIADAGPDLSAVLGERVSLGEGAGSAPGTPPGREPRWRIVRAPGGSDADLADARSPTPEFAPDVNGTYLLALDVRGGGDTTRDTVTLTARPDDPPIGVAIETLSSAPDGAIRIAGQPVKDTGDRNGVFVAVLERASRRVVESGTVPRHGGGLQQLRLIAANWGGDSGQDKYMMIVSGAGGIGATEMGAFDNLVRDLGGEKLTPSERTSLAAGAPFSIIGIPGGVSGAAWTRYAHGPGDAAGGDIRGYLQLNLASTRFAADLNYDFVSPDHLTFDTRAGDPATGANVIEVGGERHSGSLTGGATAGFHAVLVEAQTGTVLSNVVIPTNGGPEAVDGQAVLGNELTRWADQYPTGALVILQSIGHPKGSTGAWNAAAGAIERYGGNRFTFNGLDGDDDYALVGVSEGSFPAVESTTLAGEAGEAEGILTRDRHLRYAPILGADDLSPITAEMYEIAYQAPEAFPAFSTDVQRQIETDIGIYLKFCKVGTPTCEMRRRYYENYQSDWTQKAVDLKGLTVAEIAKKVYPAGSAPSYDDAALAPVRDVLAGEISEVAQVKHYFEVLQKPFARAQSGAQLNLKRFGDELKQAVGANGGRGVGFGLQLVSQLMALAPASPEAAPLLSGASGILGLVALFADGDGSPLLADDVQANVNDLSDVLANRYEVAQRATTGIALTIVSDRGKLRAVSDRIDNEWKLPADPGRAIDSLQLASGRWFARALVPATYPYLLRATPAPVGPGTPNGTECFYRPTIKVRSSHHPWSNLPQNMQTKVTLLHEGDGRATRTSLWATRNFDYQPNASIGNILFDKPGGQGKGMALGLHPLRFFDPALFGGKVYSANDAADYCDLPFRP